MCQVQTFSSNPSLHSLSSPGVNCMDCCLRTALNTAIILSVVSGYVNLILLASADFLTGVYHWSVDNYGDGSTPVVGSQIAAFQGHHQKPWTITEREFCNNVYKVRHATL